MGINTGNEDVAKAGSGQRIVRTSCDHCYYECGVLAYVENGRITKLEGDPDHPLNQGLLCAKGYAHLGQVYSQQRLLHPLRRKGDRWQRVSWEEAIDEISERIAEMKLKYGPLAISGASEGGGRQVLNTLLVRAIGSPNVYVNHSICSGSPRMGDTATFGEWITGDPEPDFVNSRCIMVVGSNPPNHAPPWWRKIRKAMKEGAKLITIDPRFTAAAAKSDIWLTPKPATDAALGLGMAHVIIHERLYDTGFVKKWCHGFDQLVERVEEYPAARAAEITGVAESSIVETARLFATTKPACLHIRSGLNGQPRATQAVRAMNILLALTGNVDVPGGNRFTDSVPGRIGILPAGALHGKREFRLPPEIEQRTIGAKEFPLCAGPESIFAAAAGSLLFDAMLTGRPYPVRAMLVAGSNLVTNHPDALRVREALKSLDLLVVSELFMSPTARLAHFVLPASDYLEREEVCDFSGECLSVRQRAVEPPGECRDDREIALELAKACARRGVLEYPHLIPWSTVEELIDYRIKGYGVPFAELKKRGITRLDYEYRHYEKKGGFPTPTGKIELYSTLLEKHGFDPLPGYEETRHWSSEITNKFPLTLLAGTRHWAYKHSMNRTNAWLKKIVPDPILEINPATAAVAGLKEGDWAEIWTPYGGPVRLKAVYAPRTNPAYVATLDGWWFPEKADGGWRESNVNVMTPGCADTQDPISGAYMLKGIPCRVARAQDEL